MTCVPWMTNLCIPSRNCVRQWVPLIPSDFDVHWYNPTALTHPFLRLPFPTLSALYLFIYLFSFSWFSPLLIRRGWKQFVDHRQSGTSRPLQFLAEFRALVLLSDRVAVFPFMASEYREIVDCSLSKDCDSNSLGETKTKTERTTSSTPESQIPASFFCGNSPEEVSHCSCGQTPSSGHTCEDIALVDGRRAPPVGELRCTFRHSFTDLPSALLLEILRCLDAKELGIVCCVSTTLRRLATDHYGWKQFYCDRWGLPLGFALPGDVSWKELFVERECRSNAFMGRFTVDRLFGHTEAVRSVFLLPIAKLVFTGGYDCVVRMWDMEEGLLIMSSRPLGCTIRAVVADHDLLVAGGTDGFLLCWSSSKDLPCLFDITPASQNPEIRLWEHQGPVTCLALDAMNIYSGSWDMSIRVWDRCQLKCVMVLRHGDWVWSLVPRGSTVASSSGRDVYIWDIESGTRISIIRSPHAGNTFSIARSYSGDLLFTGGEDGAIHMYLIPEDAGNDSIDQVATWVPHTNTVYSLAFEFPWLVSASGDGKISLTDVRKLLKPRNPSFRSRHQVGKMIPPATLEAPKRRLHGFGPDLFSVGIGADRIVCGGEEGVVRIWNFSKALEVEKKVRALRGVRLENRMRRRKIQEDLSNKVGRADQCSVAAIRNQKGDKSSVWHSKRGVSGKLKA